jgi:C-terminal peptidase prc
MNNKICILLLLTLLLVSVTACQQEPIIVEVTSVVQQEIEVDVTATPGSNAPSAPTVPAVEESAEEPTATLVPIQATLQAMADSITIPTQDPANVQPSIADDDYVGLIDQGCAIVRENYIRDDFNGVDWDAVCESYRVQAAEIEDQESFWDLMADLIQELNDRHSRFVRPDNFALEFDLPTEEEGIPWPGLTIDPAREDEQVMLWDVCETGPAASAGLQRGDVVLAVNGQPLLPGENGYNGREINQLLYSRQDEATLTVQRGPDREPEEIHLNFGGASGCDGWQYFVPDQEPRIGYLRIPSFSGNADTNILQVLGWMEEDGPLDGLVLDVRHNPGGNADRSLAIFTSGEFGTLGPLRQDATRTIYRIRGPVKWNETTPIVLLIDGQSHSAAEYFATVLQQAGRAVLVGMPTAGNTEGISGFNLADGSLIRLAITTIVLPDGRTLEDIGVQPDVQIPLGNWGLRQIPDAQLEKALEVLISLMP